MNQTAAPVTAPVSVGGTSMVRPATWVTLAIALVAALQFAQVFTRSINWDEFGHYNHIIQLKAGELTQVLQRLHAFAYSWVTALPGSPIDHIIAIRIAMFACEMIAAAAIFGVASHFTQRLPALLCVLAYLSFSYVFQHGASFRYDPPLAAALMSLLWLLLRPQIGIRTILGAGLLIALLPLISIKAVLYAPAFAGIAYMRWAQDRFSMRFPGQLALIAGAALAIFSALFVIMSLWIVGAADADSSQASGQVSQAVFSFLDNPNWSRILRGALANPVVTLALVSFPVILARLGRPMPKKIALAGLFSLLLTPLFYVNTAPYYFVFMLPPALAGCGPVFAAGLTRFSAPLIAASLCATTLVTLATDEPSTLQSQRTLQTATIDIFGEDIRYFDFPGFLGTQGKSNGFLSPLTVSIHQSQGMLLLRPAMEEHAVPLVIANNFILESALETNSAKYLHNDDLAALRDNYIRFWGSLWVAGRKIPAGAAITYQNLVPGTFTVKDNDLLIDGRLFAVGESVQLDRQDYQLEAISRPSRLMWGDNISPPTIASDGPIWVYF